jgi:hypothetical protein
MPKNALAFSVASSPAAAQVIRFPRPKKAPIVARWHLCIFLLISTNTALPARVNFVEFDTKTEVHLKLLNGRVITRRREDLQIVEYLDRATET